MSGLVEKLHEFFTRLKNDSEVVASDIEVAIEAAADHLAPTTRHTSADMPSC